MREIPEVPRKRERDAHLNLHSTSAHALGKGGGRVSLQDRDVTKRRALRGAHEGEMNCVTMWSVMLRVMEVRV